MRTLFGESVFAVGSRLYCWEDVVLTGLVRGDWAVLERDLRYGLACLARARAANVLPTKEELRAAAASFRYERNLISADEATAWLARWKVRPEDWIDYLRRVLLRTRWPADADAIADCIPPSDAEIDVARHAEAVCSGTLSHLARELAERAACVVCVKPASGDDAAADDVASDDGAFDGGDGLLAVAEDLGIPRARSCERLVVLRNVERSYRAFRRHVLSARAIAGEIRAHQLEWTVVACDSIAFDSEPAAREALLCVRADGQSLRDVARAARRAYTARRLYPDQLPSPLGSRLAGAQDGELFGPLAVDGTFVVLQVRGKTSPTNDDPEIISRAESSLFRRVAQRELMTVVQWQSAL
jgi:hypothetical protein